MAYYYVGKSTPIHDSLGKVTGRLKYCADMKSDDMLYMQILFSPIAHGIVNSIDTSKAEKLPGVVKVLTYANTPKKLFNRGRVILNDKMPDQEQLFTDHVRFIGDRIAAVIAENQEIAKKACSLIEFHIHPMNPLLNVFDSLKEEAVKIHDEGNSFNFDKTGFGDYESAEGDVIVSDTSIQRVSHIAMETHCAVAHYSVEEDKLTVWSPSQSVFGIRSIVSNLLDMPLSKVRVVKMKMGGSFGSKQEWIVEPLAAYAAKVCNATIKLVYNRAETIKSTMLKHPVFAHTESKFLKDGTLTGIDMHCILDSGAYQTVSPGYAKAIYYKLARVYDIKNLNYQAQTVCTNLPVSGSYRGWSSPESILIIENHFNKAARELGIDPVELRLKNILEPYAINKIENYNMGNTRLKDCLLKGREAFGWEEKKRRLAQQDSNARFKRGIGIALGSHYCGFYPRRADMGALTMKMHEDGSLSVNICLHDHGCGTVTVFKSIIAEVLSLSPDKITINEGDTDYNPYDFGCYSSRTVYVLGKAAELCAEKLLIKIKETAAKMLDTPVSNVSNDKDRLYIINEPENCLTYSDIVLYSLKQLEKDIYVDYEYQAVSNPGVGAAHFAEVEVDTYTGLIKVLDYLAVHDIGKALNPALCIGQIGGAVQQGMGIAFSEIVRIDAKTGKKCWMIV